MKKIFSFVFLIVVLLFATIGSEFIKPYTAYFTKTLVDKNNPFNFKNEYELLIFQNEQKETREAFRKTLDSIVLDVGDKDIFVQCVIDKNIQELKNLNKSKLNPINPKTVDDLDTELKKYQPILIEVQTESVKKCTPKKEISVAQDNIELSCRCENVTVHPQSWLDEGSKLNCNSSIVRNLKSVIIDFKEELLIYGGVPFPLATSKNTYTGIDLMAFLTCLDGTICKPPEKGEVMYAFFREKTAPAVTIDRLTGNLDYRFFQGWQTENGLLPNKDSSMMKFTPNYTVKRQCALASKL